MVVVDTVSAIECNINDICTNVANVACYKYLGFLLELSFKPYVDNLVKKMRVKFLL